MKKLIKTANIYYKSCSLEVKDAAQKFFEDIDHNHDGKVDLQEFLAFMSQEGHKEMSNRNFFKTLDWKGSKTLGFAEVLALFYIIQSGRPFCSHCHEFITGMYFTCSKCYQRNKDNVIFLCPECFIAGKYTHSHERNQFLDNYALLALERKQRIATARARARTHSTKQHQEQQPSSRVPSTSNAPNSTLVRYVPRHNNDRKVQQPSSGVPSTSNAPNGTLVRYVSRHNNDREVQQPSSGVPSTSNAPNGTLVRYVPRHNNNREHKWKSAFEALKLAVNTANLIGCVASSCTIM